MGLVIINTRLKSGVISLLQQHEPISKSMSTNVTDLRRLTSTSGHSIIPLGKCTGDHIAFDGCGSL
jgi:hypothetical protein